MTVLGCSNLADGSSRAASSWCSLEMLFDCFKLFGSWQETNMRIKLFSSPPHTPLCVIAKLKLNASESAGGIWSLNEKTIGSDVLYLYYQNLYRDRLSHRSLCGKLFWARYGRLQ